MFTGIIEALGTVVDTQPLGADLRLRIATGALDLNDVKLGDRITVDGVSLTVNAVDGTAFWLNIVPHTLDETLINDYSVGHRVNLEVDLIARYLERLLSGAQTDIQDESQSAGLTRALLAEHGFVGRH